MPVVKYKVTKFDETVNIALTPQEEQKMVKNAVCPRCGASMTPFHEVIIIPGSKNLNRFDSAQTQEKTMECPECGCRKNIIVKTAFFYDFKNEDRKDD